MDGPPPPGSDTDLSAPPQGAYATKCLCLVARRPHLRFLADLLRGVHALAFESHVRGDALRRILRQLVEPPGVLPRAEAGGGGVSLLVGRHVAYLEGSTRRPRELPPLHVSFRGLVEALTVDDLLVVFQVRRDAARGGGPG